MKAKIENNELIVSIPLNDPPIKSKSEKTMILASSHGNQKIEIDGVVFWIGLNCYTYPDLLKNFGSKPKKNLSAKEQKEIKEHNEKVSERITNGKVQ